MAMLESFQQRMDLARSASGETMYHGANTASTTHMEKKSSVKACTKVTVKLAEEPKS